MATVTMVDNKAVMVTDCKVMVVEMVVVAATVVVVMAVVMVDAFLVVAETIKDMVGLITMLTQNNRLICFGKNNKPSQMHTIVPEVQTT